MSLESSADGHEPLVPETISAVTDVPPADVTLTQEMRVISKGEADIDMGFVRKEKLGKGGAGTVYGGVADRATLEARVPNFVSSLDVGSSQRERVEQVVLENIALLLGQTHEIAVKIIDPAIPRERAAREVRKVVQKQPQLPAVARVLGGSLSSREPVILMEKFTGMDLEHLFPEGAKGKLSPQALVDFFFATARPVGQLTAAGLVHRDIKPSNLLLHFGKKGEPIMKVLDLGLVRGQGSESHAVTQEGTALGTVEYMAPEIARGNSMTADQKADVFSLGMTLIRLARGRHELPYLMPDDSPLQARLRARGDLTERAQVQINEGAKDADERVIFAYLNTLLERMIAPNPNDRPEMGEVIEDLRRISTFGRYPLSQLTDPAQYESITLPYAGSEHADGNGTERQVPELPDIYDRLNRGTAAALEFYKPSRNPEVQRSTLPTQPDIRRVNTRSRARYFFALSAALLAATGAGTGALLMRSGVQKDENDPSSPTMPLVTIPPVPEYSKQNNPPVAQIQKEPEASRIVPSIRIEAAGGELQRLAIFNNSPFILEGKDLVPLYHTKGKMKYLSGVSFVSTPNHLAALLGLSSTNELPPALRNMQFGQSLGFYIEDATGEHGFLEIGGGVAKGLVDKQGLGLYTNYAALGKLHEAEAVYKGTLADWTRDPRVVSILQSLPPITSQGSQVPAWWPKNDPFTSMPDLLKTTVNGGVSGYLDMLKPPTKSLQTSHK